jgi:hypothetical protein
MTQRTEGETMGKLLQFALSLSRGLRRFDELLKIINSAQNPDVQFFHHLMSITKASLTTSLNVPTSRQVHCAASLRSFRYQALNNGSPDRNKLIVLAHG